MKQALRSLAVVLLLTGSASAQPGVEIGDLALGCWPSDAYRFVEASFSPPGDALTAKLYFRTEDQPDFHFVEMTIDRNGLGRVIVPMAQGQTRNIVYFVELVTQSYTAIRTEPQTAPVLPQDSCSAQDPAAVWYTGTNPDIALGATRPGSTMAGGFRPDGISRFVGVGGAVESGGGSKLPYVLGGLGGGLGAGLYALSSGSDGTGGNPGDPSLPPIGGGSTTVPTTTTSIGGGGATSTTTVFPGGGGSTTTSPTTTVPVTTVPGGTTTVPGPTTSVPGSTTSIPGTTTSVPGTTTSVPGPTTSVPGPTTSVPGPTTSVPGPTTSTTVPTTTTSSPTTTTTSPTTTTSSPTTTTVAATTTTSSTTTTTSAPPSTTTTTRSSTSTVPTPNVSVSKSGPGSIAVNTPFSYTITARNSGTGASGNVTVQDSVPSAAGAFLIDSNGWGCTVGGRTVICSVNGIAPGSSRSFSIRCVNGASSAGTIRNTASLTGGGSGSSTHTLVVTSTTLQDGSTPERRIALQSFLDVQPYDGRSRGQVVFNGISRAEVGNDGQRTLQMQGTSGRNRVEAQFGAIDGRSGFWRFDFASVGGFVPGTLQVESGRVYAIDGTAIAFHVGPESPPARFTFELR